MSEDPFQFEFQPRWKEEIVCSCSLGSFVLEMTMGVDKVYFPTKDRWAVEAPAWAADCWDTLHAQLAAWCKENRIPLVLDETAYVYAGS